jgi:hypothetical protein
VEWQQAMPQYSLHGLSESSNAVLPAGVAIRGAMMRREGEQATGTYRERTGRVGDGSTANKSWRMPCRASSRSALRSAACCIDAASASPPHIPSPQPNYYFILFLFNE